MAWLSTKETAALLNYDESTIRKKVKKGEFQHQYISSNAGRGGRCMQILLESLPEQAQKAYHNQNSDECQPVVNTDFDATSSQKEKGDLKGKAVRNYNKFLKQALEDGMKKGEAMVTFITQWNVEHPEFRITKSSFYRWIHESPRGDPTKLVDKRGGHNRGKSKISKKYQDVFCSYYLREVQIPFDQCFKLTQMEANRNGDKIPKKKAFSNFAANLPPAVVTRFREGEKAYKDKYENFIERDYESLRPNEYWVSDHHIWDVFVRIPDGKGNWKLVRPWGTYWIDQRTRKILSSYLRPESPNSDIVLYSFKSAVEQFGIPENVLLDNGKDYKAHDLFNQEDNDRVESTLASGLGIKTTYAIPYNAKAKLIERFFRTAEGQFGKLFPSYAGSNAKQRPENLKDLNIMEYPTMEEFIELHNMYVYEVYNNNPHTGKGMDGKSPNEMYAKLPFTKRTAPEKVLHLCLMRVKGKRKVRREGIVFNNVIYDSIDGAERAKYIDRKVLAKYDPEKPEVLYIYDTNEKFLFVAYEKPKRNSNITNEEYEEENRKKKAVKQAMLGSYASYKETQNVATVRDILQGLAEDTPKTVIPPSPMVEIVRNEKAEENARQISMSKLDRDYEAALEREKTNKKAATGCQKEYMDRFNNKFLNMALESQA